MQGMTEILYLSNFKCFHDLYLFNFWKILKKITFKGLFVDGSYDDPNIQNAWESQNLG